MEGKKNPWAEVAKRNNEIKRAPIKKEDWQQYNKESLITIFANIIPEDNPDNVQLSKTIELARIILLTPDPRNNNIKVQKRNAISKYLSEYYPEAEEANQYLQDAKKAENSRFLEYSNPKNFTKIENALIQMFENRYKNKFKK